ncbi:cytochrome C biogenesis protein [Salinadaptatus halalkaliphilus]|uniref:Cytochrome C biogenesis protein n=1 Tax=Salinadaptatus halalkaliphilus TaxID=2419781 RepID=A0A4S3TKP9_9EURY|nr:cytochrome c biogenesis protein CcdA [Salinadaptatus halalkaliphilus]THE64722.1 cytochrome C biogenesis protein [Salinadaptatus halalkaliphilus]
MSSTTAALLEFFVLGVATPLTAACVIPLYPSFLSYLAAVEGDERAAPVPLLGLLVVAGVVSFLAVVGVVWTVVFGAAMTNAVEVLSPIAFTLLLGVGIVLVVDPSGFSRIPTIEPPHTSRPTASAFGYGFFFGAIVIPCNPGLITLFVSRSTVAFPAFDSQLEVLAGFVAFGLGIGTPLLAFALLSQSFGRRLTRALAAYSDPINRFVGVVLLVVSSYYLVVVFQLVPGR